MMTANPPLGLLFHWIGGLMSASFYIPYRRVKNWSWATYWLVGGAFAWIFAPLVFVLLFVPNTWGILAAAPWKNLAWAYFFGVLWGVGGVTFGLTMRYLGIALGYAMALGFCAAFGTLMPPLFDGTLGPLAQTFPGRVILGGVAICL